MIVDSFDYIACYKGLHPNLDKAIDWLNSHTLDALENGKTIIDGENVFVNVMDADLRDADGAAFEYHRRYADLQIDLTGSEHWGWASEGKDEGAFDEAADCGFKSGAEHVGGVLGGGRFAIFFPGELHKPSCKSEGCNHVRPNSPPRSADCCTLRTASSPPLIWSASSNHRIPIYPNGSLMDLIFCGSSSPRNKMRCPVGV